MPHGRRAMIAALAAFGLSGPARTDEAGQFDYYVLALSWSPTWCALEGDAREAEQCDAARDLGWILHGLWPQYERGWPESCPTSARLPSRGESAAMADVMGSGGLAWYQWKKHGSCSGLDGADYYALSRRAYDRIRRPDALRRLDRPVRLPAGVIEEAFVEANPDLDGSMIRVTCEGGRIDEVRICLTRDLAPRPCAADIGRDCPLDDALLAPIR